jgi:hypothetical protein
MANGVKAERLDFCLLTQAVHEALTDREGFSVSVLAELAFVKTDKHERALFDGSIFPPPAELASKLIRQWKPIELQRSILSFPGPEPDAATCKIHIRPLKAKNFAPPCSSVEEGQKHHLVLALCDLVNPTEILLWWDIPWLALLRHLVHETGVRTR